MTGQVLARVRPGDERAPVRTVKLAAGVGPLFVLALLGGWYAAAPLPSYLVVTVVAA